MDITPINTNEAANLLPVNSGKMSLTSNEAATEDQLQLSAQATELTQYMQQVLALPESRPAFVAFYKSQIKKGLYPPQASLDGLIHLIGRIITLQQEQEEKNSDSEKYI